MVPTTPAVDEALPALRQLLAAARVSYRFVGGIAVVHHGYARMTEDIDVLIQGTELDRLDAHLAAFAFVRCSRARLLHAPTGVRVDLLVGGEPGPRPGEPNYPQPDSLAASPRDPCVVGLAGLFTLKLRARRHQDLADLVALLKAIDDGAYLALEAEVPSELRSPLADLRRDAVEELRFADRE